MNKNKISIRGIENIVKDYYRSLGYKILKTNYRCRQGKIDIVAKDMSTNEFVFTEYKSNYYYKNNINNINNNNNTNKNNIKNKNKNKNNNNKNNKKEQKPIVSVTKYYTYKYNLVNKFIRFDLVEINIKDRIYLKHFKNCEFEEL